MVPLSPCHSRSPRPWTASPFSPGSGAVAITRRGRDSPGPWAKPLEGTGREDGPARSLACAQNMPLKLTAAGDAARWALLVSDAAPAAVELQ